ncbi:MAG: spore maturation protein [Oscillospiraceae bacterium]|nr:spore maturation protein [Oscillospiraceae bacterium]
MKAVLALLPALLLTLAGLWGLGKKTDVYAAFTRGAADALPVLGRVLTSLAALLPAVYMLRASGALEAAANLLSPLLSRVGVPPETVPLLLIRPLSGSAALALGIELMARFGPDSPVGRTAAVMLGSTETTFYVISVYFGGAGAGVSRRVVAAALCADLVGFLSAAWSVRLFFP